MPVWEEHLADSVGAPAPSAQTTAARRAYFGMISMIDEGIGRVVDALERTGVQGHTWIILHFGG
ncbi:hypothetical protein [Amycolatopsis methanolica]|uniref:hypothetical protein n=1 Tax=Amycolatopsis methanolica TaxID=1814 RepID=UPI003421C761